MMAIAVMVVAVTMSGCENGVVEPPRYTTVEDEAAVDETRDGVGEIFARAVTTAREATGAGELRNGDSVRSRRCDELYPARFQELEIAGSFVVENAEPEDVIEMVASAWQGEGWQVSRSEADRVVIETDVGDGVRVVGVATVAKPSANADVVGISLSVGTGCLELPESAEG